MKCLLLISFVKMAAELPRPPGLLFQIPVHCENLWIFFMNCRNPKSHIMCPPAVCGCLLLQAPLYYRNANAAFIVYDITCPNSFEDVKTWIKGKKWVSTTMHSAWCKRGFTLESASLYNSVASLCAFINSLCPSDTIWRQRSGSTLAQIMACCLTAPSHYLNQCWLEIIGIHPSAISQKMHKICQQKFSLKLKYSWIFMHLSGANELTSVNRLDE